MAKSPGPAIAMAAAAALFLLSRGGSDDSDDTPEKKWEPPAPEDDGTTTTEDGDEKPPTGGTGGGTDENPPNVSNDPAGYNTNLWTSPRAVRSAMIQLGYPMTLSNTRVVKNALMTSFQRHYNWVSANPDAVLGDGPFTARDLGPKQSGISSIESLPPGNIQMDGTAGKNTLNALEVALKKTSLWNEYISSAGADLPSADSSAGDSPGSTGEEGGSWGTANGPCTVVFDSDHGGAMQHTGLDAASVSALNKALSDRQGVRLQVTTQFGIRGMGETDGTFDVVAHDHYVDISVEEMKALSRGETISVQTKGPNDDKAYHTHPLRIGSC